jgi:phosphoserine phosphatase
VFIFLQPPGFEMLDDPNFQRFLSVHANHHDERPIAVFDCDGTVIRGDIGEAMLFYQLEHFHFLLSPGEIWKDHPQRRELDEAYGALANADPAGRRGHPAFEPFAHFVLEWYFGQIAAGKVEKACADIVRLLSGYSAEEVRILAEATFLQESSTPLSERNLGGYARPLGIRYIVESVELLKALQEKGFDIWVISGSNRWSV